MDTKTPLTDREAGRVKTVLKQEKGIDLRLRELTAFSPDDIAVAHKGKGIRAGEIARYAGRKQTNDAE